MELDVYDLYQDLKRKKILFCYSGPIAHASIEGVGRTLRMNLEFDDAGNITTHAVFSIFVEQVQNILNYSAERLDSSAEYAENELSVGVVAIGREDEGNYFVYCGNKIYNTDISKLSEKLDELRTLSKEELKALYKERRRMEPPPGSKGAGLGLIEIARRAGKPIEYAFREIDEEFSFFIIKVVVGRE